jgi:ferredoxin
MNRVNRKDFFRQGFFSLGEALLSPLLPSEAPPEAAAPPLPGEECVARPDNGLCLARSGGCFTCQEQCAEGALVMVPGEGLQVLPHRCSGCGTCVYVCPLEPKGIALVPRGAAPAAATELP